MTREEFIKKAIKKGVQNDSTNVWVDIDDVVCIISIDVVLDHEETYPFEASDYLESNTDDRAWDVLYNQYLA